MKTPAPKAVSLTVDLTKFDARNIMFFDRFAVFRSGGFYECHFGFYGCGRDLQKGLIAVISERALKEAKESLLGYVKKSGQPELTELPECRIRGEATNVIPVDVIGLAQTANLEAEILFHTFSTKVAVERSRAAEVSPAPVVALCTGLLRCDINLQKRWIIAMYEQD